MSLVLRISSSCLQCTYSCNTLDYVRFLYSELILPPPPPSGQIPQFGYCDEVNMGQLVQLRSSLKDKLLEKGVKFSYMPVIVKALSLALLEYPMLNAHVDHECTTMTYKADHNIGIAMDTPDGLIVPNVKGVQVSLSNLWSKIAVH